MAHDLKYWKADALQGKGETKMNTLIKTLTRSSILLIVLIIMQACSAARPIPFKTAESVNPPMGASEMMKNRGEQLVGVYDENIRDGRRDEETAIEFVLQDVLEELLDRFESVSDLEQYGKVEYWATPSESSHTNTFNDDYYIVGDCDEFALHAWKELRKRDIKARLVTAVTKEGSRHIVVESDGWILDNNLPFVVANNELDYQWEKISGYDLTEPWKKVDTNRYHQPETLTASASK